MATESPNQTYRYAAIGTSVGVVLLVGTAASGWNPHRVDEVAPLALPFVGATVGSFCARPTLSAGMQAALRSGFGALAGMTMAAVLAIPICLGAGGRVVILGYCATIAGGIWGSFHDPKRRSSQAGEFAMWLILGAFLGIAGELVLQAPFDGWMGGMIGAIVGALVGYCQAARTRKPRN